jgi:hypothetical protein
MTDLSVTQDGPDEPALPDPSVTNPWDTGPDDPPEPTPDPTVTNPWDTDPDA